MAKRFSLLSIPLLLSTTVAVATNDAQTARNLTTQGVTVGWIVQYVPPDPNVPPDPYFDATKAQFNLFVNADQRTDLNQQVVFRHTDGQGILPCVRVAHGFLADGSMSEVVNLLDPDDHVHLTVPAGYVLVPEGNGYTMAPAP